MKPEGRIQTLNEETHTDRAKYHRHKWIVLGARPARAAWRVALPTLLVLLCHSVAAQATSAVAFLRFEFVELKGRAGHMALFPIPGQPIAGSVQIALAKLSGPVRSVTFKLVSESGATLSSIALQQSQPDTAADDYVGAITVPSQPFRVVATGVDTQGASFALQSPQLIHPQTVSVRFEPTSFVLLAGTTTLKATVTNHSADDTFSIQGVADKATISRVNPQNVALRLDESATIDLDVAVPIGLPNFTTLVVTAVATSTSNPAVTNSAALTQAVEAGGALAATKDSSLLRGAQNRNEGANPRLQLGRGSVAREHQDRQGREDQDRRVDRNDRSDGDDEARVVIAFDSATIRDFVTSNGLTKATLELTIAENADNWTVRQGNRNRDNDTERHSDGQLVDAHPLRVEFIEGNGKSVGLAVGERTTGTGRGVTWNCATDDNIANNRPDCRKRWDGAESDAPTADPVRHVNGLSGTVSWDVTSDVRSGVSAWVVVKRRGVPRSGQVHYYSREGAAAALNAGVAPRLLLQP